MTTTLRTPSWHLLMMGGKRFDAQTANTFGLFEGAAGTLSGASGGSAVFYFDPADWAGTGGPGPIVALRTRLIVITNATAPVCNFTLGLYPVSTPVGAAANVSVTAGTLVTSSSAVVTAPGAGTLTEAHADFAAPAVGFYALQLIISANMAANSAANVRATLAAKA